MEGALRLRVVHFASYRISSDLRRRKLLFFTSIAPIRITSHYALFHVLQNLQEGLQRRGLDTVSRLRLLSERSPFVRADSKGERLKRQLRDLIGK